MERKVPKYENHQLRERKMKTLTKNWRDHKRTGTHKYTETVSRYFDWHGSLSQSKESKCCDTVFVVCSKTFTLFWLRKTAVPVEISRYSFRVFVCACPFVISSIPGKSFHFPFPYIGLDIYIFIFLNHN